MSLQDAYIRMAMKEKREKDALAFYERQKAYKEKLKEQEKAKEKESEKEKSNE